MNGEEYHSRCPNFNFYAKTSNRVICFYHFQGPNKSDCSPCQGYSSPATKLSIFMSSEVTSWHKMYQYFFAWTRCNTNSSTWSCLNRAQNRVHLSLQFWTLIVSLHCENLFLPLHHPAYLNTPSQQLWVEHPWASKALHVNIIRWPIRPPVYAGKFANLACPYTVACNLNYRSLA